MGTESKYRLQYKQWMFQDSSVCGNSNCEPLDRMYLQPASGLYVHVYCDWWMWSVFRTSYSVTKDIKYLFWFVQQGAIHKWRRNIEQPTVIQKADEGGQR